MEHEYVLTQLMLERIIGERLGKIGGFFEPLLVKEFSEWFTVEADNAFLSFDRDDTDESGLCLKLFAEVDGHNESSRGYGFSSIVNSVVRSVEGVKHDEDTFLIEDARIIAEQFEEAAKAIRRAIAQK